jgi:hypothetical protein
LYAPILNHPQDFTYELGTVGNSITWTLSDLRLDSYEIYRQDILISSSHVDESHITIDVDGLEIGSYNFTIAVKDTLGKIGTDTVLVTVADSTIPQIDNPEDIQYELGSTGNIVTWNPSDLDPDFYRVCFDGAPMNNTSWNGGSVSIGVDGLSVGSHYVSLIVGDVTGNTAIDTVVVEVKDTVSPSVSSPNDMQYEEGVTGNSINWNVSDLGMLTYVVRRNDSTLLNGVCNDSEISLNIDFLAPGVYNYTLVVTDEGGNSANDSVLVVVLASTPATTTTTSTTPTTTETPPPESSNPMFIGIAAVAVVAGASLIVILFVIPRMKLRGQASILQHEKRSNGFHLSISE